jgi:RNA polymerase sigma-70 factor (sigma-E family)
MPDTSGFSEFAEASITRLRETAFLLSRDWHLAQDLTQITLAKVYLKWRRIDDPHAYAKKVLLHTYLDHQRRRTATELTVDEPPETPTAHDQPELRLTLLQALGHLPPRDQAIVVLRYWEDLSIRTVADLLDLSESTVKIQSMRALAKLRALLDENTSAGTTTG